MISISWTKFPGSEFGCVIGCSKIVSNALSRRLRIDVAAITARPPDKSA